MRPGMTMVPVALMTSAPSVLRFTPTAAMRLPSTSTSPVARFGTEASIVMTVPPLKRVRELFCVFIAVSFHNALNEQAFCSYGDEYGSESALINMQLCHMLPDVT